MRHTIREFSRDLEFSKLLRREDDVDLTVASLELARDQYPDLNFQPTLDWIAERGRELAREMPHAPNDRALVETLSRHLAGEFGLRGSRQVYDHPDGSCLNRVVESRTGLPIALSIVYMAVAQSAGILLQGVAAPGHFLTRYDTLDEPIFVDAYTGGKLLTLAEAVHRVSTSTDSSAAQARRALLPVGARPIIVRMLNNLKALQARLQNWPAAYLVQRRLTALQPAVYSERRDLGLVALKTGRAGEALELLQQCHATCPNDERDLLKSQIQEAEKTLSRWN